VDDVTVTLSDDVEHNHSIPRELVESPKGSHERVSHSPPVKHVEVHEASVESAQVQMDLVVEHVDVHSGSRSSLVLLVVIEQPLIEHVSMPTTIQEEQVVASLQQQEVHPSKNIQHGLDLWERVCEYDKRSTDEDFTPVLTRKQNLYLSHNPLLNFIAEPMITIRFTSLLEDLRLISVGIIVACLTTDFHNLFFGCFLFLFFFPFCFLLRV